MLHMNSGYKVYYFPSHSMNAMNIYMYFLIYLDTLQTIFLSKFKTTKVMPSHLRGPSMLVNKTTTLQPLRHTTSSKK